VTSKKTLVEMFPEKKVGWEMVHEDLCGSHTVRLKVEGGYLYRYNHGGSMVFVPDIPHQYDWWGKTK
jgi:hypothetical protein